MARLASFLLLLLSANIFAATIDRIERADYFIEAYGRVSPEENGVVTLAYQVFDSLAWIANNQISNVPRLVVVASSDKPWAISLPDNSVILSMGAVTICEALDGGEKVEACLAFVLGHELAHLSNRDFWHRDTYQALMRNDIVNNEHSNREIELKADEIGFLYASLAGYRVEKLFDADDSLFDLWSTRSQADARSNNSDLRRILIKRKIEALSSRLELAEYAFMLTSFDLFEDAIPLYKELIDFFPAKEFLNNTGYSYLRIAKRLMQSEDRDFIFPAMLDAENPAEKYSKATRINSTSDYIHELGTAVVYFKKALKVNERYIPALYNLAVSQYFLGEFHEARALIERAIKLDPDNLVYRMIRAIVIYKQETDVDMWPLTVTRLELLAKRNPDDYLLKYNIAEMYRLRNLNREARNNFTDIIRNSSNPELKSLACLELTKKIQQCSSKEDKKSDEIMYPDAPKGLENIGMTKWVLGYSTYKLYVVDDERWLYINNKPILYSYVGENSFFQQEENKCKLVNQPEYSVFGGAAICKLGVNTYREEEKTSVHWVRISK